MAFSWLISRERAQPGEVHRLLLSVTVVTFSLVWGVFKVMLNGQFAIRLLNVGTMLRRLRLCCNWTYVALKIVVAYRPVYYHLYKPWWRFSSMQSSYLYIFYLGCNFLFKCVADNFSHFPYYVTSLWDVLVFVTATPKYSNSYHQKYCRKTKGQWIAVIFKTLHVSCQIEKFMSSLFIMFITLSYKVLNWLM